MLEGETKSQNGKSIRSEPVRKWLRENGYPKVADAIDRIEAEYKSRGVKTRRNWWDVLAGRKDGKPCVIAGYEFPVLEAAQRRQGHEITEDSLVSEDEDSRNLKPWVTGRWPRKKKKRRAKG